MAALSDADLVRILGEDARSQLAAASANGTENPEVARKKALLSIENAQFTAVSLLLMAVVLFISAYYTQTGTSFTIQCSVAGAILVVGIGWSLLLSSQKKKL